MSPAHSCPGVNGMAGGQNPGKSPLMMCASVPQIATARTRHNASYGCGEGIATCSME